jgi:hypothetical protein
MRYAQGTIESIRPNQKDDKYERRGDKSYRVLRGRRMGRMLCRLDRLHRGWKRADLRHP